METLHTPEEYANWVTSEDYHESPPEALKVFHARIVRVIRQAAKVEINFNEVQAND